MVEGRATARYIRTSAQKAGLVMDLLRGQNVDRALSTLRFARKRIARDIEKVLRSAVANAEQKEGGSGDVDRMFVSRCYADQGPSMKRIRPAPMGRAFRIIKRTAHLTVHVAERSEVVTRVAAPAPQTASADGADAAPKKATKRAPKSTAGKTTKAAMAKKTAAKKKTATKSAAKKTTATKKSATESAAKKTAKTAKKRTAKKSSD